MKSIIKLINIHFWKSILSPFFAFIFPIIFLVILGLLLGYDQLLAGALSIPSMAVGLIAMPQAIFEFKKSVLLKRIGVTKIKPWMFLLAISSYYIAIMFLSTAFCIAMSVAIFSKNLNIGATVMDIPLQIPPASGTIYGYENIINVLADQTTIAQTKVLAVSFKDMLSNVNWAEFTYAVLMNVIVSTSLGLMLVSILKSSLAIQALGVPILIISQFLSAQVLPIPMIKGVNAMYYLSYISPFKYSTGLMINAWDGSVVLNTNNSGEILLNIKDGIAQISTDKNSIFNINAPMYYYYSKGINSILIYDKVDKILNLVMPFVWTGLFGCIAVKFFKWNNR